MKINHTRTIFLSFFAPEIPLNSSLSLKSKKTASFMIRFCVSEVNDIYYNPLKLPYLREIWSCTPELTQQKSISIIENQLL